MLSKIHKSTCIGWVLILMGGGILSLSLVITHPAMVDPQGTSMTLNMLYYGLSRLYWLLGVAILVLAILLGHFPALKKIASLRYTRLFARATAIGCLVQLFVL